MDEEIAKRKNTISDGQYIANVIILSIQWSVVSFSYYLLMFMNKYYEGSIYINYYLDGCAGILGPVISILTYDCLRIRLSFFLSVGFTIVWVVFLLVF